MWTEPVSPVTTYGELTTSCAVTTDGIRQANKAAATTPFAASERMMFYLK
jgi:hypothetical protein